MTAASLLATSAHAEDRVASFHAVVEKGKVMPEGWVPSDLSALEYDLAPGGRVVFELGARRANESLGGTWLYEAGKLSLLGTHTNGNHRVEPDGTVTMNTLTPDLRGTVVRGRPGSWTPLLTQGDPVPDVPGAQYNLTAVRSLGRSEGVLVLAQIARPGMSLAERTRAPYERTWIAREGRLDPLVFAGDPMPGIDGATFRGEARVHQRLADGRLLFEAVQEAGMPGHLFSATGRDDGKLVLRTDVAPAPFSGPFGVSDAHLAADGKLTIVGSAAGTSGLWAGTPGALTLEATSDLVEDGSGPDDGGIVREMEKAVIGPSGIVALRGRKHIQTEPGLWVGAPDALEEILTEGMPVRGLPGVTCDQIVAFAVNAQGQVAISAQLSGVGAFYDSLLRYTREGGFELLASGGRTIDVEGTPRKIDYVFGSDEVRFGDDGRVLLYVRFAEGVDADPRVLLVSDALLSARTAGGQADAAPTAQGAQGGRDAPPGAEGARDSEQGGCSVAGADTGAPWIAMVAMLAAQAWCRRRRVTRRRGA